MFSVQPLDENISTFKFVQELFKRTYEPLCGNLSVTLKKIRNSIDRRTHLVLYKQCTFNSLITTKLMKAAQNTTVAGLLVLQNSTTNIYAAYGVTDSLEIKNLIIAPEFRSLGLGSALLAKAVFEARQCPHALSLHILISEGAVTGTKNFLLAHGFHQFSLIGLHEEKTLFALDIRQNISSVPPVPPPVNSTSHSFSTPPLNTEKVIPVPAATASRKTSKILPARKGRNRKSSSLFVQHHQEALDNNNFEDILPASKRNSYRNRIYTIINYSAISNQPSFSTSPNTNLHSQLIHRLLQLRNFPLCHRITTTTKFLSLFSPPSVETMNESTRQQRRPHDAIKGMLHIGLMRNIRVKDFILWIIKDKEDLTTYHNNKNNDHNNNKSSYYLTRVVKLSFEAMSRPSTSEPAAIINTSTIDQGEEGGYREGDLSVSLCRLAVDRVHEDELRLLLAHCSRKSSTFALV